MIQVNELRQNNWYRCKIYNGNNDVLMQFTWQEYKYVHLFDGIPLSPEILEKCEGFIRMNHSDPLSHFTYHKDGLFFSSIHGWWYFNRILDEQPKYLHELQNIIWSLTKQELIFKP